MGPCLKGVKMKKQTLKSKRGTNNCFIANKPCGGSCSGAIYGFGFIGSAIYYISTATGFWAGVLGILKSIIWPTFLVFELMKYLGM